MERHGEQADDFGLTSRARADAVALGRSVALRSWDQTRRPARRALPRDRVGAMANTWPRRRPASDVEPEAAHPRADRDRHEDRVKRVAVRSGEHRHRAFRLVQLLIDSRCDLTRACQDPVSFRPWIAGRRRRRPPSPSSTIRCGERSTGTSSLRPNRWATMPWARRWVSRGRWLPSTSTSSLRGCRRRVPPAGWAPRSRRRTPRQAVPACRAPARRHAATRRYELAARIVGVAVHERRRSTLSKSLWGARSGRGGEAAGVVQSSRRTSRAGRRVVGISSPICAGPVLVRNCAQALGEVNTAAPVASTPSCSCICAMPCRTSVWMPSSHPLQVAVRHADEITRRG